MSQKMIGHKNENAVILAAIASFTVIVVAGIWFFSGGQTRANNNAPGQPADDMAGHHSGNTNGASTAKLDALVGQSAPNFTLTDREGKTYNNENLKGKNVVLFFNEGLMCYPACWEQIVQLAADNRFNNGETVVLSVVVDSAKDWQRAIDKMPELAKAAVVFDTGRDASSKFGVLTTPSSMHYGSLPGHSYVVIDKAGVVRHVYDDPRMAIHNNQLVAELDKLK